jgi:hypothetical protein
MLDALRGMGAELMSLIDAKQYFVLHAARQSGKTTLLFELVDRINAKGDCHALYCSLEAAQPFTEPDKGIPAIIDNIEFCVKKYGLPGGFTNSADCGGVSVALNSALVGYCRTLDKPLVILFDEADCLSNGTLISFLRQLRDGYISRGKVPFVHSIALVGMRNIRDYRGKIRDDTETIGSSSPFNIVTEALNLRNFTVAETAELYAQHTAETGQTFEQQAVEHVFEQTQGQPWLVNAIARECVEKIAKKDYAVPITQSMTEQAIQNIILARGTHVDSLLERLKEPRVRRVIQPLITGEDIVKMPQSDDYPFTKDLGLIRDDRNRVEPANPIYAELIVRALTGYVQDTIKNTYKEYAAPRYLKGGKFDMDFLMRDFQEYWRQNSEIWRNRYKTELYEYDEAAAQLVMHAFLQRVVNGGGQVMREMAAGTRRTDICVVYDGQKYPIELKLLQSEASRAESLKQLRGYMDKLEADAGWLVVFDRNPKKFWSKKTYVREVKADGKRVVVVGC